MYPAYIHTQTTARNIDHAAIKTYQIPSLILMEHAALKSAEIIEQITNTNQSICILCGPGNNGADGLAIARLLQPKYPNLYVVVPEIKKMSEDEKIQFQMVQNLKFHSAKIFLMSLMTFILIAFLAMDYLEILPDFIKL